MNQELGTVGLQKCNRFCASELVGVVRRYLYVALTSSLTLVDFHLRDGLPPVHRHEPGIILSPAAQVQDQLMLVAAKSCQYGLESLKRELARGEEE